MRLTRLLQRNNSDVNAFGPAFGSIWTSNNLFLSFGVAFLRSLMTSSFDSTPAEYRLSVIGNGLISSIR